LNGLGRDSIELSIFVSFETFASPTSGESFSFIDDLLLMRGCHGEGTACAATGQQ
jgi:hypothetical protein